MLGKTYMAMRDKEKALLWLTKAKQYPAHTLEDKEVRMLFFFLVGEYEACCRESGSKRWTCFSTGP